MKNIILLALILSATFTSKAQSMVNSYKISFVIDNYDHKFRQFYDLDSARKYYTFILSYKDEPIDRIKFDTLKVPNPLKK